MEELQDERHPHKYKPDGGIDGWMSREESLSHPLSPPLIWFVSEETPMYTVCLHIVSFYHGSFQPTG